MFLYILYIKYFYNGISRVVKIQETSCTFLNQRGALVAWNWEATKKYTQSTFLCPSIEGRGHARPLHRNKNSSGYAQRTFVIFTDALGPHCGRP